MAGGYWIKLDWDWRDDPKVMAFEDEHGKAALVDLVQLWCVMGEFYGRLDMADRGQRLKAQRRMGMGGPELEAFLDQVAECGLISPEAWACGVASSERAVKDGEKRQRRKDSAIRASQAAAEKRREKTP